MLPDDSNLGLSWNSGEPTRHMWKALTVLACILAVGVAGLMWIEGWEFWRAFYFALITVTTVGYGDEGISEAGQRFSLLLIVGGIGAASYTFALVVQTMVTNQFAWRRRMQSRIDKLDGHVLVCGFGRMGRTVCEELEATGTEFVVIEQCSSAAGQALERGYAVVHGSATEDGALRDAGVRRAGHMVCAMDRESENIVASLSARQLRPDLVIIARAERPEEIRKLHLAGATRTVAPFHLGGVEIANAITRPKVADFLAASVRAESKVALAEILIEGGSPLEDRTLADCGAQQACHVSFVTLERPGEPPRTPPRGTVRLGVGDLLIVAGDPEQVAWMQIAARAAARPAPDLDDVHAALPKQAEADTLVGDPDAIAPGSVHETGEPEH